MSDSENEIDKRAHKRLLDAVGRLQKTQYIKKATRNETALKRSEFHLVKTKTDQQQEQINTNKGRKGATADISVNDLVKVLSKSKKHLPIGQDLRNSQRNKKVLNKPLERPVAEKIQRSIGYEKAKKKLNRWNAVVERNRASDHLSFPLQSNDALDIIEPVGAHTKLSNFRIKSDLMREIEALEPQPDDAAESDSGIDVHEKLSREEILARSKEMRFLRIRESQKSAKARMQNKIKSKKFHKIMKKEKLKEQMKEFEILQKIDPEAALRKLEQIEKHRVEERALLRHKNTGTWAKNLQVRAKYDKEVRKELSEQLSISRQLTEKNKNPDDDSDQDTDTELAEPVVSDPFNPWTKKNNSNDDEIDETGGYRKYWNERNENDAKLKEFNKPETTVPAKVSIVSVKKSPKKPKAVSVVKGGWIIEDCSDTPSTKSKSSKRKVASENLDDLFDQAEENIKEKVAKKLHKIQNELSDEPRKNRKPLKSSELPSHLDLSFKKQINRPQIDEELNETELEERNDEDDEVASAKKILSSNVPALKTHETDNINPETFVKVKPTYLRTALPDMEGEFDEDEEMDRSAANKRLTIAEAFEDDDIVADFQEEKELERKKAEPEDIDLTLPGWGSWAGSGIKPRSKKLILKFPKEEKRNEENKGHVIIVDNANRKIREHQVSSLPFPFTSVKDYEASIRAPIGKDFVPEIAHRLLTKPAVTTKLGTIISPMDETILVKKPRKPLSKTEQRIAAL